MQHQYLGAFPPPTSLAANLESKAHQSRVQKWAPKARRADKENGGSYLTRWVGRLLTLQSIVLSHVVCPFTPVTLSSSGSQEVFEPMIA